MKEKPPAPRNFERNLKDLKNLLEKKKIATEEELNKYLQEIVDKGEIPKTYPKNAKDYAQEIIYEAWEIDDRKERIKLANEALSIYPDCVDAYNILAEEKAETIDEAKEYYEKAVQTGERTLGKEKFKEYKGHFWGILETRPYMRARAGLAQCLWERGNVDEAIGHYRAMLDLNPNDNQGIRYILAGCYAKLQRYDELDKLLNSERYKGDVGVEWVYTEALLTFLREGATNKANKKLGFAIKRNPHVPKYLVNKKVLRYLPDSYIVGSEDEAMYYATEFLSAWEKVSGAIGWLKEQAGIKTFSKVGRNEPCPCGSGKKFKKCCGR